MLLVCVSVCATLILESSSQKPIHYDSAKSNRCKLFLVSQRTSITTTICTQYNLLHVLWYLFNCKRGITSSPGWCLLSDWMAYIYLKSIRNYWLLCLFRRFEIEFRIGCDHTEQYFPKCSKSTFLFLCKSKTKIIIIGSDMKSLWFTPPIKMKNNKEETREKKNMSRQSTYRWEMSSVIHSPWPFSKYIITHRLERAIIISARQYTIKCYPSVITPSVGIIIQPVGPHAFSDTFLSINNKHNNKS